MQLFANPLDETLEGFSFETFQEFERAAATLNELINDTCRAPIIDFFVFDFIDGTNEEKELFEAAGMDSACKESLEEFMDVVPDLNEQQAAQLYYMLDIIQQDFTEAVKDMEDVNLHKGSASEAAAELFDDIYGNSIPPKVLQYVDMDKFLNDLEQGGDFVEFHFAGHDWVCTNNNSF